jgi:hypothetical protein
MAYEKEIMILAGSGAAAVLQTYLVKNYIEPTNPVLIPGLPMNLGNTGTLIGMVTGIGAIALGYHGMRTRKILPDPRMQMAAMAYGGAVLTSALINSLGVYGGMLPAARARAFPRAAVRSVPSGSSYNYMASGKRETNIL